MSLLLVSLQPSCGYNEMVKLSIVNPVASRISCKIHLKVRLALDLLAHTIKFMFYRGSHLWVAYMLLLWCNWYFALTAIN